MYFIFLIVMEYQELPGRDDSRRNFEAPGNKKIVDTIISWARSRCEKMFPQKPAELELPEEKERQAFEASESARAAEYGGILALLRGDKEKAAAEFREALEYDPENKLDWRILSHILVDLGRYDEARAASDKT